MSKLLTMICHHGDGAARSEVFPSEFSLTCGLWRLAESEVLLAQAGHQ